jgi:hypothetical protein
MKSYLLLGFVSLLYENQNRFSTHFASNVSFSLCVFVEQLRNVWNVRSTTDCAVYGNVCLTAANTASGYVSPTAASAASGYVSPTAASAASGRVCPTAANTDFVRVCLTEAYTASGRICSKTRCGHALYRCLCCL